MTSDIISMEFDYGDLPTEKVLECETAFQTACAIENQATRMIGEQFAKAKENLKHLRDGNGWREWCDKKLNISHTQAQHYINEFENGDFVKNLYKFGKSARWLLVAPNTPQEVRDRADAIAEAGGDTSHKAMKKLKEDYEAERQARELFERRARESQAESNERRKTIRDLESQLDLLKNQPPEIQVRTPADYEATKAKAAQLETDLAELKKQQATLVQKQLVAKLKERAGELEKIDREVSEKEIRLETLKKNIDRYSLQERELNLHREVIEKTRAALAYLAANMDGFLEVIDQEHELRQWRALADMLRQGAAAIDYFIGDAKPTLPLIHGDCAA